MPRSINFVFISYSSWRYECGAGDEVRYDWEKPRRILRLKLGETRGNGPISKSKSGDIDVASAVREPVFWEDLQPCKLYSNTRSNILGFEESGATPVLVQTAQKWLPRSIRTQFCAIEKVENIT
jgi:hypothetical protein